MFFRGLLLSVGLAVPALVLTVCPAAAELPAGVEITTARPAATFLRDEGIEFVIRCNRPLQAATWAVTRHGGGQVASGTMALGGDSAAALRVRERPGVGYYTLTLTLASGEAISDVFCVLPPPDEARGEGGIFGLGYKPRCAAEWDIYRQMGARHVRAEFPWPEVEREPGEYDLGWVDQFAADARARGIQLTVLTGHTPRAYGQRPIDAEGRVATAWYTWQPAGTIEWYRFISTMAGRLLNRRISVDAAHPTDTLARGSRPLVVAWEVWSEADQNFYYGDWDRYLDMLRIAYCTIRARERVPVVYGSCGHLTEMNATFWQGCGDYFDMAAYHPHGSDPDYELMHWFRNMPQAWWSRGVPRDSAFTECDFHAEDAAHEAGFIVRLAATLRAWRQPLYVRSGCTGGCISTNRCSYGLVWYENGRYVPRPAYVGFAVARWLLESARYIGPLEAPAGARLELFMRGGVPMIVGWTEGAAQTVRLDLGGPAGVIEPLGGVRTLRGASARVELSEDTVAVVGASYRYLSEAATAAAARWLTTELGHDSPTDSRYVEPLEDDAAACIAADFPARVRAAVRQAGDAWDRYPPHGASAFFAAQRTVGDGMVAAARNARGAGGLQPVHTNTIWRLAEFVEHLGEIADGAGERWWRMNNVSAADMAKARELVRATRRRVPDARGGARCPGADRLLDRAERQLALVSASGGHRRGAWWAAVLEARAAHALTGVEQPRMIETFTVAEFPTAEPVTKGKLLPPDSDHELLARVYNFLPRAVSGAIRLDMPDAWPCATASASFSAPASGPGEPVAMDFCVPEQPTPWVQKTVYRPFGCFDVDLPEPLRPNEGLSIAAEGGHGGAVAAMGYQAFVGAWPSRAASAPQRMRPAVPVAGDDARADVPPPAAPLPADAPFAAIVPGGAAPRSGP